MRKYQETTGYWVYAHTTPNGMCYIGMSKQQPSIRWQKSKYKDTILEPYIAEYCWENIKHKVVVDGLTKEQAEQWEDRLIQALSMNGICINKKRSGGLYRDDKQAYMKRYDKDRKEERKAYNKQRYVDYNKKRLSTPEGKIYNRVKSYNKYHTPIETPAEAKRKYIEYGYIPTYIKNNDLK